MKTFEEYKDGDWVVYVNTSSVWHLMNFQCYKSQWTHNAFRLKFGAREVVADISEIQPMEETNKLIKGEYENSDRHLQRSSGLRCTEEEDDIFSQIQD